MSKSRVPKSPACHPPIPAKTETVSGLEHPAPPNFCVCSLDVDNRTRCAKHFETISHKSMSIEDEAELTRRQKRIIPLLLSKTVTDACKEARVGRKTFYDWMKQNAFRHALEAARDEVFSEAMGLIKVNVSDAVNVVVGLMRAAQKEDSRIRAVQIVIEHARWLKTSEDLQRRIDLLEQAVSSLR